jgi:cytidyltransferase-like protein
MPKKVFVSGFFDLFHSGHIAFLEEAARYGDLHVSVGSDQTYYDLRGRLPINNEDERLYIVRSLSCVKEAFISRGTGILDFVEEFIRLKPDLFIVNEDGNLQDKKHLCERFGVEYQVLERNPRDGLQARSSSELRTVYTMPFRIDIAGGWLDQPFVSRLNPGPVITTSIHPSVDFNERSGMASSTRVKALDLWGPRLPAGDPEKLARILFCYDNPPGKPFISGSQDTIGIVYPGLAISHYEGEYWPKKIESVHDELTISFVERALYLIPLGPRGKDFDVLADTKLTAEGARALADAANSCWQAILTRDLAGFGRFFRASFEAQIAMFPHMYNDSVAEMIAQYRDRALGWKLSGAGGGGYLILVADQPVEKAIRIHIRRKSD